MHRQTGLRLARFLSRVFRYYLSARHPDSPGSRDYIGLLDGITWAIQTRQTYAGRGEGRNARGRGGCLWKPVLQGSGAGLRRSPRFAPSLGLFGKKRGGAVRADLYLGLGAHCVCTPVPLGYFHNVRSGVTARNS